MGGWRSTILLDDGEQRRREVGKGVRHPAETMLLIGRVGEDRPVVAQRRDDRLSAGAHRRLPAHVEELEVLERRSACSTWQENWIGSTS